MLKALQNSYPNAKSIYIESKAIMYPRIVIKADLSVYVRVPKAFSQEQILDFIHTHQSWIHTTLAKLRWVGVASKRCAWLKEFGTLT